MDESSDKVRLPAGDELIAPVKILDAEGNVLRVVSAAEFRRAHPRSPAGRFASLSRGRASRALQPTS